MNLSHFIENKHLWLLGFYSTKIKKGFIQSEASKRYSKLSHNNKENFLQTYTWRTLQHLNYDDSICTRWDSIDVDAIECVLEKDFYSIPLNVIVKIKIQMIIVFNPNQTIIAIEEITF